MVQIPLRLNIFRSGGVWLGLLPHSAPGEAPNAEVS
jgi:hypothetical protein